MVESGGESPELSQVSGPAQYAARARTRRGGDVWFTIGQGWAFERDGRTGYTVRLAMTPTDWDGELILMAIPEPSGEPTD